MHTTVEYAVAYMYAVACGPAYPMHAMCTQFMSTQNQPNSPSTQYSRHSCEVKRTLASEIQGLTHFSVTTTNFEASTSSHACHLAMKFVRHATRSYDLRSALFSWGLMAAIGNWPGSMQGSLLRLARSSWGVGFSPESL